MKVVVLAGGYGTRLRSIVKDVPKPMADIGGRPFLQLLLDNLINYGATEFILCVSYLREVIQQHFGSFYRGVPLRYSVEETPLGTGGAIKKAFKDFNLKEALVINGDTFCEADYRRFFEFSKKEPLCVLLKKHGLTTRYGTVKVEGNRIIGFKEKDKNGQEGLINAGVYKIDRELLSELPDKFSFEKDFLEIKVRQLQPSFFLAQDYFIDIGVPESYKKACKDLSVYLQEENKREFLTIQTLSDATKLIQERPKVSCGALFLDRDGVINFDSGYVHLIEDCKFIPGIFQLCQLATSKGYKIIIVTNQAGIGKGFYTESDFHFFMDHIKNEFSKNGCKIDDVFYCPYHPEGLGVFKGYSFDRKPFPGMILKAKNIHNIDVSESILIGDKMSDIEAGKNAGVGTCILLVNKNLRSTF